MKPQHSLNRRLFLTRTAQTAGLLALADFHPLVSSSTNKPRLKSWTV